MASKNPLQPSTKMRSVVRAKIRRRIAARKLSRNEAAARMGLTIAQTSRLVNDYDAFSLDRLVDAAKGVGVVVRIAA